MTSILAPERILDPALRDEIFELSVLESLRLGADAGGSFLVAGEREVPLAEMLETIERRARAMVDAGLAPGERVGVWMPSSYDTVLWMYAVMAAGGSTVAMPPGAKDAEADQMAALAEARWVIGRREDGVFITPDEAARRYDGGGTAELPDRAGADEAACFTTSGSTGTPKLTALSHTSFAADSIATQVVAGGDSDETFFYGLPLCHVAFLPNVHFPLSQGRRVAFLPVFDAVAAVGLSRETGAAYMSGSPAIFGLMLQRCTLPDPELRFRRVCYGAGAMPAHWAAGLGEALDCEVVHAYGLTEGGGMVAVQPPEEHALKAGTTGKLLPSHDGIAIWGEDGSVLGTDEPGEIVIRGRGCTSYYVGNPDETAETIQDGWVRTGDLGRIDADGDLFISGRLKDQINRGGLKVGAREVEAVIEKLPGVTGVGVVSYPCEVLGERVGAAVEASDGGVDVEAVRAACAEVLSDYKVPERILVMEAMPRTSLGKPNKPAIRELIDA